MILTFSTHLILKIFENLEKVLHVENEIDLEDIGSLDATQLPYFSLNEKMKCISLLRLFSRVTQFEFEIGERVTGLILKRIF